MKAFLDGKTMSHPYPNQSKKIESWVGVSVDLAVHPVVRTLPGGRKSLLLPNRHNTHPQIVGMDAAESDKLIQELFDHVTSGPFTYTHNWKLGDTLAWNNRGVVHSARGWDSAKYKRLLQRSEVSETTAPA